MIKTKNTHKIMLILLSIFFLILFLEIGLRIGGLVLSLKQSGENLITAFAISDVEKEGAYTILALGESTTASGIMGITINSWPSQLERILNNRSKIIKFRVFNKGLGGTNTAFILARLEENLEKYNPDMVITMIGSNDEGLNVVYDDSFNVKMNLWIQNLRVPKLLRWVRESWKNKLQNKKVQKISENDVKIMQPTNFSEKIHEYINFGRTYLSEGKLERAEESFRKALAVDKSNYQAYSSLGDLFYFSQNFEKAAEMYEKAIELNPKSKGLYSQLGICYGYLSKFDKAEKKLIIALQYNPTDPYLIGELGRSYLKQGKKEEAKIMFTKFMESAVPDYAYRMYTGDLIELGYSDKKIQQFYNQRGYKLSLKQGFLSSNITKYHYQKLYEILKKKKVKYVAMQYPTLRINVLNSMFDGDEEIIFVSNEENFKKALENGEYEDYFIDNFAGNWGHATSAGNRLIAENIAEIILNELKINKN